MGVQSSSTTPSEALGEGHSAGGGAGRAAGTPSQEVATKWSRDDICNPLACDFSSDPPMRGFDSHTHHDVIAAENAAWSQSESRGGVSAALPEDFSQRRGVSVMTADLAARSGDAGARSYGSSDRPAATVDASESGDAVPPPLPYREKSRPMPVLLHVYDLGRTPVTQWLNFGSKDYGAFHTGVEVFGLEWSFGMTMDDSTGVACVNPKQDPDHSYRETIDMGIVNISPQEFSKMMGRLRDEWPGSSYQLLSRNCHHFSDCLLRELGVGYLPSWCNSLAGKPKDAGEWLTSGETDFDGGVAVGDFFSSVTGGFSSLLGAGDDSRGRSSSVNRPSRAPAQRGARR